MLPNSHPRIARISAQEMQIEKEIRGFKHPHSSESSDSEKENSQKLEDTQLVIVTTSLDQGGR